MDAGTRIVFPVLTVGPKTFQSAQRTTTAQITSWWLPILQSFTFSMIYHTVIIAIILKTIHFAEHVTWVLKVHVLMMVNINIIHIAVLNFLVLLLLFFFFYLYKKLLLLNQLENGLLTIISIDCSLFFCLFCFWQHGSFLTALYI